MEMQVYIGYEDVFHEQPQEDRLSLIEKFSKRDLLAMLALINLHPSRDPIYHTIQWKKQIEILCKLCVPDKQLFLDLKGIDDYHKSLLQRGSTGVLFSRVTNVVAMNEVLQSDRISHLSDERLDARKFIEYYLSVNSFVKSEQDKYTSRKYSFLEYYPVMAVYNEYNAPFFSFLELYRGVALTNFMQNDEEFGGEFSAYFASIGFEPFLYFPLVFSHVIPLNKRNKDEIPVLRPTNKLLENVIRTLSGKGMIESKPLEALNLKANSFYPYHDGLWILLDESFLLDHCFQYTINSFWFNHMKPAGYNHKSYFAKIGRFYENYISEMIHASFHFLENPSPKTLNDLVVRKSNEEFEVTDVYVREGEKIFIAEIKSTSYNAGFKYADDVINTFEENEFRFVKDFGLLQVLNAIKFISENHNLVDENAAEIEKFQIFPAVIFNEKLFQTPFANLFFQNLFLNYFKEVVGEFERPKHLTQVVSFRNFIIHPISLIHTTELEMLEPLLANKRVNFWELLLSHQQAWGLQVPLYHTVIARNPHDLVEYGFQKILPILAEYDKRRKEALGE